MTGPVDAAWELLEPDPQKVEALASALGLSTLTATLLVNRGLDEPAAAQLFLRPRLADLPDPAKMQGMARAVDRIIQALEGGERICVWGDYDVDGVTSASQLIWFFRALGHPSRYFVPDRFRDGYGLNADRIRELLAEGMDLLITVDCGVSNYDEVEVARDGGADVIIVDHHQCPPTLPRAHAVLNPHQPGCDFPDKGLAACGVTWMLLVALRRELRARGFFAGRAEPDLRTWLDLTAIGTVADMVPLLGINRVIVRHGLELLQRPKRVGVGALCEVSGLRGKRIKAGQIGFHLGPRINAAGRIASASAGVAMLTTEDPAEALDEAQRVDRWNAERRGIQDRVTEMATEMAEALEPSPVDRHTIVLAHEEWHPGVLGIVASKLVERFHRPTVLLALDDDRATGSARSIAGFKLVEHLRRVAPLLVKYGGHDHAAGLTVQAAKLSDLAQAFEAEAAKTLAGRVLRPLLRLDAEVHLDQVGWHTLDELHPLEPFGQANRTPVLLARGVRVLEARLVGQQRNHLKLRLAAGHHGIDAIAFGKAHKQPVEGSLIDIAYLPDKNEFRGNTSLQLLIRDLRPNEGTVASA